MPSGFLSIAGIKDRVGSARCFALLNGTSVMAVYAFVVIGLLKDEKRRLSGAPITDWHVAFGIALLFMVLGQFFSHKRMASGRVLADNVYLVLYTVFGLNELIRLLDRLHALPGSVAFVSFTQPPENLRVYLIYGVLAIMAAHSLPRSLRRDVAVKSA